MITEKQEILMLGETQLTYGKIPSVWTLRLSRSFVGSPLDSLCLLPKHYPGSLEVNLSEDTTSSSSKETS